MMDISCHHSTQKNCRETKGTKILVVSLQSCLRKLTIFNTILRLKSQENTEKAETTTQAKNLAEHKNINLVNKTEDQQAESETNSSTTFTMIGKLQSA